MKNALLNIPGRTVSRIVTLLSLLVILYSMTACAEPIAASAPVTPEPEDVALQTPVPLTPTAVISELLKPTAVTDLISESEEGPHEKTDAIESRFPGAAIILNPGDTSTLISPVEPKILVRVHPEGIVHIDLIGRGDFLYARHLLDLHAQSGQEILVQPVLPFETVDASEPARLVVRLLDRFGRTISLTSANLTLLSNGRNEIQPSSPSGWIDIISPLENEEVSGKSVQVIASVSPVNSQPIVAELITEEGTAINSRLVKLPADFEPGQSVHLDFSLPYAAAEPTPCLLTLYQASYHQIEGKLMLTSKPITLLP